MQHRAKYCCRNIKHHGANSGSLAIALAPFSKALAKRMRTAGGRSGCSGGFRCFGHASIERSKSNAAGKGQATAKAGVLHVARLNADAGRRFGQAKALLHKRSPPGLECGAGQVLSLI